MPPARNKKTKDKVILREMRQKPGEVFNANLARRSMQRVNNLGFFEDVNLKMNPGVEPNAIVLEIDRLSNFSAEASSDGINIYLRYLIIPLVERMDLSTLMWVLSFTPLSAYSLFLI